MQPLIAVVGGNACSAVEAALAEDVGRRIAQRGAILICGGRDGIMAAACKGAAEAGGVTVGILPGEDVADANPYVQIPIASGIGIARNVIIVRTAAAIIAISGKYGTLSEIAHALQIGKPVFSLGAWGAIPGIHVVDSPEAAVQNAFDYLGLSG